MDDLDHLLARSVVEPTAFMDIAFADVEPIIWQAPAVDPPWVAVPAQQMIIDEPLDVDMPEIEPPVLAFTFGMTERVDPPTLLMAEPAPAGEIDEPPDEYIAANDHPIVSWFDRSCHMQSPFF